AFVVFNTKNKLTGKYENLVQYMPMCAGLLKKLRNTGELASITVNVVRKNDEFRHWTDDAGEHITHEPNYDPPGDGPPRAPYIIGRFKHGGVQMEVMTQAQIEAVRKFSKAPNSPAWSNSYDEMCRTKVTRRFCKRAPSSSDLERTIQHHDEFYSFKDRRERL